MKELSQFFHFYFTAAPASLPCAREVLPSQAWLGARSALRLRLLSFCTASAALSASSLACGRWIRSVHHKVVTVKSCRHACRRLPRVATHSCRGYVRRATSSTSNPVSMLRGLARLLAPRARGPARDGSTSSVSHGRVLGVFDPFGVV
eukprot:7385364-Prymnesium_polylepis.1